MYMRLLRTAVIGALLMGLIACSSRDDDDARSSNDSAAVDAGDVAKAIQAKIPEVTGVVVYDENSDPNELIGRPGQYTSAARLADSRGDAQSDGIDGGAVVEVFASESDAANRSRYIQDTLSDLGPAFGTEWHFLAKASLLRISGGLGLTAKNEYEQAWQGGQP
ncbi:hypothetical protein ACFWAY_17870 [Rhodococcus sp. NPDC059968]|uniref:hypothetical protein n=1 Tax=Rhodococcus sp. NPDC059968 TaxID=3347017 RepID=UPI003673578E